MKKYTKGFTLIELLVVIAIIGILASVVLASLSTARNKGADAAVKGAMSSMRNQAEIYYGDHSNRYNADGTTAGAACLPATANTVFADTSFQAIARNIDANDTGPLVCTTLANGSNWAVSTTLKGGGTWCVDSTGIAVASSSVAGVCS